MFRGWIALRKSLIETMFGTRAESRCWISVVAVAFDVDVVVVVGVVVGIVVVALSSSSLSSSLSKLLTHLKNSHHSCKINST